MRIIALVTAIVIFTSICRASAAASTSSQQAPVTPPRLVPPPFTELIAAYPFGTQISLGVSPNGNRVYVAEGGGIRVLDTTLSPQQPPVWIHGDDIELPETSPYSILRYTHPSSQVRS